MPIKNRQPLRPLAVISLYTGAGGLDLGFEAAGFETRVAVENDPEAVATLKENRSRWSVIDKNIDSEEATSTKILKTAGLRPGDADVLLGGPPCQPFSKSGYWARGDARRLEDPRSSTLAAYLRVLRETQPRAFLLENVPGLAFSAKDEGLTLLQQSIERINHETSCNYSFNVDILRAVEHGVPQDRQRVFVVGSRDGSAFRFPQPTHAAPAIVGNAESEQILSSSLDKNSSDRLNPYLNTWDAIGDLADDDDRSLRVTGKWADLLPSIPEGRNYLHFTDRGGGEVQLFGWRRRYWSFLLKLSKELPSWTIAAQPGPAIGPFHWTNRKLSPRELMRLQTFPEGYTIIGSQRSAQRQLGNAVPSALAERLALEMRRQLFAEPELDSRDLTLIPKWRGTPPPPEATIPVAAKYRAQEGNHAAHPGTGLGYGAIRRASVNADRSESPRTVMPQLSGNAGE